MALSSAMIWEVQTGGSDANNSGGFRGGAYISAPSAPTVTPSGSGGTVAAGTYYVVVTYTDGLGETVISGQTAVTTSGGTASFTITSPGASTGALTWSAYCGTTSGGPYFPQGTGLTIGSNRVVTTTPPTTGTQPRGVDRSLSTTRQVVIDNSTITATTTGANSNTLTFTGGYTPTGADVGNTVRLTAGTNINAGCYEITAITSTTWTLAGAANATTAGGAGSAIVGGMGGCFASPGQGLAFAISGNTTFIKAGTYTLLNGTVNTAGNKIQGGGSQFLVGYSTNRTLYNTDTPPVLDAGAASMTVLAHNGNSTFTNNLAITNSAARASVVGWSTAPSTGHYRRISVSGCTNSIAGSGTQCVIVECSDSGCGGMGALSNYVQMIRYVSTGGTGSAGIRCGSTCMLVECVVNGQTSGATGGIDVGYGSYVANCNVNGTNASSYACFNANSTGITMDNCIAINGSGSGGTGFNAPASNAGTQFRNCATYNNTIAFKNTIVANQLINCVALSADPFTNAAGNDFSLNTTAGAGAACRAAGIPGTWPGLSTTGYRDIGAAQTSLGQPGAGGAMHLAGRGGGLVG